LLALVLVTGCASQQLVHFHVMRQPTFWRFNLVSLARKIRVTDGNREIGSIAGQRGFLSWETEPGETIIFVPDEAHLEVTVKRGKVHYIVVRDMATEPYVGCGTGRMTVELKLVGEKEGREELAWGTPPH